jgi:hypothetical protein
MTEDAEWQPTELAEFELEVLQAMAGLIPSQAWGGAVGQALEVLRGHRLIEQQGMMWVASEQGLAELRRRGLLH